MNDTEYGGRNFWPPCNNHSGTAQGYSRFPRQDYAFCLSWVLFFAGTRAPLTQPAQGNIDASSNMQSDKWQGKLCQVLSIPGGEIFRRPLDFKRGGGKIIIVNSLDLSAAERR
ncbi:hypothetical protein CISG_00806 [Coccidioides immitis RMSCC 3703]|uniref:Uncharacterized protein n=1 Tax=Coccidioides immitis RMSCC 3703 TaxID=454286 RepID=A0A0J8QQT6_COCIT|nr:hypothetical protein CISG_00806 [Coccidioides immitis RMSCC 3703]